MPEIPKKFSVSAGSTSYELMKANPENYKCINCNEGAEEEWPLDGDIHGFLLCSKCGKDAKEDSSLLKTIEKKARSWDDSNR